MSHLLTQREGPVLVVTMNRPEAKNAWSPEMLVAMADAWDELDRHPALHAAILTGAGGVFCAGADLKAMNDSQNRSDAAARFRGEAGLAWKAMLRSARPEKPVIAAVEGFALAGGTEILQGTDIRVAAESAVFGVVEVTRGLFPVGGSTVRLQRQISFTKAMELLLTGSTISAQEALEFGLVGRVVPDGHALETALQIGIKIAGNGPLAVRAIKKSILATAALPEEEALKIELEIGMPIFQTADAKEGTLAFKEKRPPQFEGR